MTETTSYQMRTRHQAEEVVEALANDGIAAAASAGEEDVIVTVDVPPDHEETVEGVVGRFDETAFRLT